ncbi:MAG: hypothetical protein KA369_19065 [Spirochaetes bacterium]|nr:hypothetical protein [Spirochaetota bacterium]
MNMRDTTVDARLGDMLVEMDMNLFSLQVKTTRLVMAILSEKAECSADISVSISHARDDEHHVVRCSRIYIDPEDELIKIEGIRRESPLAWDDLEVSAQYRIAQHLYTEHLSGTLKRVLTC